MDSPILGELCRVLAPGGRLVLGTPDYDRWEWVYTEKAYGFFKPGGYADEHIAHYTRAGLEAHFAGLGYVLEDDAIHPPGGADSRFSQTSAIIALHPPAARLPVPRNRLSMRFLRLLPALLLLCPATGAAQTVTSIGTSSVKAADDYATHAFQDPWDMNQKTDFGPMLGSADLPASGFTNIAFASGVFSGTTTTTSANVWLLDTGNPFAAPLGKIGTNYPDRCEHLQDPRPANERADAGDHAGVLHAVLDLRIVPECRLDGRDDSGFRTYLINLASSPNWTGTKRSLQFSPALATTNNLVQIDWMRLVSVDSSLCRAITWTGAAAVDIYLDTDLTATPNLGPIALTANAGQASPGCPIVGGAYNFYAGALPGGTYRVFVTTAGAGVSAGYAKYTAGSWVVNDAPTLTFTSPSEEGSDDDFATTQLGNPWDMNAVTDVDFFSGVNSPQIAAVDAEAPDGTFLPNQRVLYGTSAPGTAPCPATPGTSVGDPIVELLENNRRGRVKQIDADRYRLLTVEFGLPNKARDVACGSVARIVWRAKGDTGNGSVSDDIIFNSRAGTNLLDKITVDLKTVLVEQGTGAGGNYWVNGPGGGIDIFRFDPHEFTPATPFFIKRVKLAALEQANTTYTIRWNYSKPSGIVELYYTTIPNDFNSGILINVVAATAGQYVWTIPPGVATSPATPSYIYAKFTDGVNSNQVYRSNRSCSTARTCLGRGWC